jgi:hypothetical protein
MNHWAIRVQYGKKVTRSKALKRMQKPFNDSCLFMLLTAFYYTYV